MADIIYYFVPKEHMDFPENQKERAALNIESWTEIIIADSENIYEKQKWYERMSIDFFVDKANEVAEFLWDIKHNDEEIFIKKKPHRFKKEYISEVAESKAVLAMKLDELSVKRYEYALLYTNQGQITKRIYLTPGETIDLFVKNDDVDAVEKIIGKWADKSSYFKYELDEQEENQ